MKRREVRSARRELREHQRAAKEAVAKQIQEVSQQAVERYELQLRLLSTVHAESGDRIDWSALATARTPEAPEPMCARTVRARTDLESYRPSVFARLFGGAKKRRAELEQALERATREDEEETRHALALHAERVRETEEMHVLARALLAGDTATYVTALARVDAFEELEELARVDAVMLVRGDAISVELTVDAAESVIPEEAMSLTQRGRLSTKKLGKTKRHEIYQDFVCGAALRACREVFAALPVAWVLVTVRTMLVDKSTGHLAPTPLLSIAAPRATIEGLAFDGLDPSDAMTNLVHRMEFKKTTGLGPTSTLTLDDVPAGAAPTPYR
jgi:hypothetical protein